MPEIAAKNLTDVPLYTPFDVARYLRAPVGFVIAARHGRFHPHLETLFDWFEGGARYFIRDEELPGFLEVRERWSFRQMADLYVRLFAVEVLAEMAREEPDEARRARNVADTVQGIFRVHHPLPVIFGTGENPLEGINRLVEACRDRLDDEGVRILEGKLLSCLARFDTAGSDPVRLYPFSRVPFEGSPRIVVIDPEIRFGRPTVAGHGTPTDILLERHQAGDSVADLAEDYGLSALEVEETLRYEAKPLTLLCPFFCW